jgi:hypothetical protein
MNFRAIINRTIILSVFAIAGYLLARSMYYGSFLGILLAVVAIGAWTIFLYKLSSLQAEPDPAEEVPENY